MSSHIAEITMDNAQALLIDESFKRPIVVDFWADWCGPCKSLMPIMEKLANEYDGQFLLAKVNSDEQQMLASQFGVRSLPTVLILKDGQPVDGFTGLKAEQEVRETLDKYLPKPWDIQLIKAREHISEEAFDEACTLLREAYRSSEQQADIALALAEVLITLKRYDESQEVLSSIKMADQDAHFQQVQAQLELAKSAQKAPELQQLEQKLSAQPDNMDIRFQLAVQYYQNEYRSEALSMLYEIICKDINFKEGEAKKTYLDILAVMGKGDPVATEFQRKLYTLLH
ncbi:thioredoxin [Agarilytica rhodophyticola]|uniref:thioredoxin n=1 Tax=Agarilytica rhodophyticola TaxID=1737490 RepID=UPI000B345387|nr:thioredoxin [Agarilytica rhodophyticola]